MNKKLIRLTESDLHRIVRESVNKVLKEAITGMDRDFYGRDEDGKVYTDSKKTYRGVPGSKFIWHGEWSDPEILWDGELINYNVFEDNLYEKFRGNCGGDDDSDAAFERWIKAQGGVKFLADELDEFLFISKGGSY